MKKTPSVVASILVLAVSTAGCASIPGKTGEEQAENMDALVERTLADLY